MSRKPSKYDNIFGPAIAMVCRERGRTLKDLGFVHKPPGEPEQDIEEYWNRCADKIDAKTGVNTRRGGEWSVWSVS